MKSSFSKSARIVIAAATSVVFVGAFALAATDARSPMLDEIDRAIPPTPGASAMKTLAELEFPDAPFGVDPMVTGPSSDGLQARQGALGCAEAVWPQIPVDCYPN